MDTIKLAWHLWSGVDKKRSHIFTTRKEETKETTKFTYFHTQKRNLSCQTWTGKTRRRNIFGLGPILKVEPSSTLSNRSLVTYKQTYKSWLPFDPLTDQSLAQADMLLDPKRLNLGLDKEAEVLEVGYLDESISLEFRNIKLVRDSILLIGTQILL